MLNTLVNFSKKQLLQIFLEVLGTYCAVMLVIISLDYFSYKLLDVFFWIVLALAILFMCLVFKLGKEDELEQGAKETYYPMAIFIITSSLALFCYYDVMQFSEILIASIGYLAAIAWFWIHVEKMTSKWESSIKNQHNYE